MTMPSDDAMTEVYPVRRMEVFTGAGHRRTWSDRAKARIVAESYTGVETVCAVARRYGLAQTQLFTWRREARKPALAAAEPLFAPVVVEPPPEPPAVSALAPSGRRQRQSGGFEGIELEIDGVVVRVGRGAEAKTVAAVIRALKADAVIGPTGAVRVLVATKPVDFRKGMDGLAALVKEQMRADPFSGAVYVFRAKRADRIKLIFWDGTGLCLFAKRLEDGQFRWPKIEDGVMRLTSAQLAALLEGLDWRRVHAGAPDPGAAGRVMLEPAAR